jgi:hypothetical protein
MKNLWRSMLSVSSGALILAQGCAFSPKSTPPLAAAATSVDRDVSASEAIVAWEDLSQKAARALMTEYGVPDEVGAQRLTWNRNGPWRKTVVYNVRPSPRAGVNMGIIEQSIDYPLSGLQASGVGAFDSGLGFNSQTGELSARSDGEDLNFLRLNLADEVAQGRLTPHAARARYAAVLDLKAAGKGSPELSALRFPR